jgi:hypothetical protein
MNKEKKKKTRCRDFLVTFHNPDLYGFFHPNDYLEFLKNSESAKSILRYLIFQWEITPQGETSKTHYQMYFEFLNYMSIKKIQNDFFQNRKVYVEPRAGTQEEAMNYCSNLGSEFKERVLNEYFEYGSPKRTYSIVNRENKDIPFTQNEQFAHILEEIKNGKYKSLLDVEKDYPILRFTKDDLIQKMLNIKSLKKERPSPARVIYLFSKDRSFSEDGAGTGKSVWTNKCRRELGYKYSEVYEISPPSMVYGEHFFFDPKAQFMKVLIINEADKEFPKRNNLIAWIDRIEKLDVKNGQKIDNNFELIFINSIYRPEEVFSFLGKRNAKQVLRRIFNSHTDSCVYNLTPNLEQLEQSKKDGFKMSAREFEDWYKPSVERIFEPDWDLVSKE